MPSLWSPTDWPHRLAELQASKGELKEAPLRRDVRSLGMLLGEVLREQVGNTLYEAVEALRRGAIARRETEATQSSADNAVLSSAHLQEALDRVRSFELPAAYQLARAFSFYFELINLAETNHRKRRRLSHQLEEKGSSNGGVQRGDLRGTLRRMREAGVSAEEARALLRRVCVYPVFTAHPTEVARRSVMFKRRRISDLLERLDRIPVPESELKAMERDLLAEITALWQTDDVRSIRPTVRDEIRMALDYYEASLFDTLPVLYAEVGSALAAEYPKQGTDDVTNICELPELIRFGSWIGGDRDGNPVRHSRGDARSPWDGPQSAAEPLPSQTAEHLRAAGQLDPAGSGLGGAEDVARPLSEAASNGGPGCAGAALSARIGPSADRVHHDAAGCDATVRRSGSGESRADALHATRRASRRSRARCAGRWWNTAATGSPRC